MIEVYIIGKINFKLFDSISFIFYLLKQVESFSINFPLTMCVGPAKKRASPVPKAFGMCVEAFFCLVPICGIVFFSSKEKERRSTFKDN
jgi:hypothetical protein